MPVHASTLEALGEYGRARDQRWPDSRSASFFVSTAGTRLVIPNRRLDVQGATESNRHHLALASPRPRLYDLRHRFAVRTLISWYEADLDVEARLPLLSTFLGHSNPSHTFWYLSASPQLLALAAGRREQAKKGRRWARSLPPWSPVSERLIGQPRASANTVAAYRDAWRLLLGFTQARTNKTTNRLELADLDAGLISAFLEYLETERGNSVRTRNARRAAIRSFFHYAALRHPEHAGLIANVLAIPAKRQERKEVCYLTGPEVEALVESPDRGSWTGRNASLAVAVQTGLRVSELTAL